MISNFVAGELTWTVSTIAGSTQGDVDGTGTAARFRNLNGITVDSIGNLYVTDSESHKIRKITPAGVVSTLAGSTTGYADGIGTTAQFNNPTGIIVDNDGNLYVTDSNINKIRKITPAGFVSTVAGSTSGYADGTGGAAQFIYPHAIAKYYGGFYIVDSGNYKIRQITANGVVSTVSGYPYGYSGSHIPTAISVFQGNFYVTSNGNYVKKITLGDTTSIVAGTGTHGFADGGTNLILLMVLLSTL